MYYTYQENEARVMRIRDNAIESHRKKSYQYKEKLRLERLGWLFLALIPFSLFLMLYLKMDVSNSGFLNAMIYSEYKNSVLGWVHGIAIILLLYKGFSSLGKANKLESDINNQIKNELYEASYVERAKDNLQIVELRNSYKNLTDADLENSFRNNIQDGINGSHIQKLHYLALHQIFLERYGYSPFHIEDYDTNEKTIELRKGRLPSTNLKVN